MYVFIYLFIIYIYIYIYIWPLSETPYTGLETLKDIILFGCVPAYLMTMFFLSYGRRHPLKGVRVESARKVHGGHFEYVSLLIVHCTRYELFLQHRLFST